MDERMRMINHSMLNEDENAKTIGVDDRFVLKQVMGWYFGEVPMSRGMDGSCRLMIGMLYVERMQFVFRLNCYTISYRLQMVSG